MAKVDYATLKKGGFMRQKQKNNFSLDLPASVVHLQLKTSKKSQRLREIRRWLRTSDIQTGCRDSFY